MIKGESMNKLAIMTTYECTASCAHCMMNSRPERNEKLSTAMICETVDKFLHEKVPLQLVVFTGGEATLLYSDLLDAIAFCSENGLKTRLITNAWWASSKEKADIMIDLLCEVGLSEINFSADDYHAQYIEFDYIKNAWHSSKCKGFDSVVIANMIGPKSYITDKFICEQLQEDVQKLWINKGRLPNIYPAKDGTKYLIAMANIQRLGQGKNIPEDDVFYPKNSHELKSRCVMVCKNPALSAEGHLLACCGFDAHGNEYLDLGNLRNKTVMDLWNEGNQRLFIRAVNKLGPYFIMNFVKKKLKKDIFKHRYCSMCEICSDISSNKDSRTIINAYAEEIEFLIKYGRSKDHLLYT